MMTRIAVHVTPPYTVLCKSVEELKSEKSEGLWKSLNPKSVKVCLKANLGYTSSNSDATAVVSELPAVFISN